MARKLFREQCGQPPDGAASTVKRHFTGRKRNTMKKAALALFVALVMGVTTFGVIETAYAQKQPAAGSGSGTTKTTAQKQPAAGSGSGTTETTKKKRRRHHKKKAETHSGFVTANQF
jgi:hypothetical protein